MKDRQKLNNGKSSIIKTPTLPSTYAAFKTACENGTQYMDINPNDNLTTNAGVSEVGTPLDVATLLSDSTALALGLTSDATPDDAFQEIANAIDVINTITIAVSDWVSNSGGGYKAVKSVNGMLATSKPLPALHYTTLNEATCKAEQKAYTNVRKFETAEDQVTVFASAIPTTAISIDLRGI